MNSKSTYAEVGYSSLSVMLHWLMLLLIVAIYALMDLKTIYPRGSHGRDVMAAWHYTLGISVFCLVWIRIWARCYGNKPEIYPPMPKWRIAISQFVHLALYALMICLPVLGWFAVSAKGITISLYGLELPTLVDKNKNLFILFKGIHENFATLGYFMIGLHAAAALFHHYFKRDNILSLMIPRLRR